MHGMGMMGPWMMAPWTLGVLVVGVLLLLVAVLLGGVWLGRRLAAPEGRTRELGADPVRSELNRRYAAGEIGREEYLQHKVDLEE